MIRVLLDTNILHQEGMKSTRFQVLKRLIQSDAVSLVIPEIVIEEYKTKRHDIARDDLRKVQSAIDNLHRKSFIEKDSYMVSQFTDLIATSINSINKEIDSWLNEYQISMYPISNTSIEELFKSYFAGTGAFRNKKQREDIPDAVIYDCVTKFSQDEELAVVIKDNTLLDAISKLEKVNIFKDLSELLETPTLKEKIAELNNGEKKVHSIIDALNKVDNWFAVSEFLNENELINVEGEYKQDFVELPYELNCIEFDNQIVTVTSLKESFLNNPTYLGSKRFSYDLNAECTATLTFQCENDVYESLPYPYRKVLSKSECNHPNEILVKGEIDVSLQGVVVLSGIEEDTDANSLMVHLEYLGAERSPIKVEVNIEKLIIEDIY